MAYQQACLNGDGYGVGWYRMQVDEGSCWREGTSNPSTAGKELVPCVFTSLKPAWNDPNLQNIAEKVSSPLVVAHVRAAGPGMQVGDSTCHPFKAGRFLFAHNGLIGKFAEIRRRLLNELPEFAFGVAIAHGCIDSAVAFALFLAELGVEQEEDALRPRTADEVVGALSRTLERLTAAVDAVGGAESLLNFVISDGTLLVACRFATLPPPSSTTASGGTGGAEDLTSDDPPEGVSLYLCTGTQWAPEPDDPGLYRMKQADARIRTTIIASEPLTPNREEWLPVAPNSVVMCQHDIEEGTIDVLTFPLRPRPPSLLRSLLSCSTLPDGAYSGSGGQEVPIVATSTASSPTSVGQAPGHPPQEASLETSWTSLTGHREPVVSATSAFDGKVVITGSIDGAITVVDLVRNKQLALVHHNGPVLDLLVTHFSPERQVSFGNGVPDTNEIATAVAKLSSGAISPKRPASKTRRKTFERWGCPGSPASDDSSMESPRGMAVWEDRTLLFSSSNNELRVWDLTDADMESEAVVSPSPSSESPVKPWGIMKCLFCFHFTPAQGRLLSVAGTINELFLGFQSTRIYRLQLGMYWHKLCSMKTRSRSIKFLTFEVNRNRAGLPSKRPSGGWCHHDVLQPVGCAGHLGFVHSLAFDPTTGILCSGGGDGRIIFWRRRNSGVGGCSDQPEPAEGSSTACMPAYEELESFNHGGAVLALTLRENECGIGSDNGPELFSGDSRGRIRSWDLRNAEHGTKRILGGSGPAILALAAHEMLPWLCAGDAAGVCRIWDTRRLTMLRNLEAGLSCCSSVCILGDVRRINRTTQVISTSWGGDANGIVKVADVKVTRVASADAPFFGVPELETCGEEDNSEDLAHLLLLLSEFVAIPTVSGNPRYIRDCHRGAAWLCMQFEHLLGCSVKQTGDCVIARHGWNENKPVVVFYSHYDVVGATESQWDGDPWTLTGKDNYLYGRGATDCKGPLLAQIFAVRRLQRRARSRTRSRFESLEFGNQLSSEDDSSQFKLTVEEEDGREWEPVGQNTGDVDVVFIVSGTEESGKGSVLQAVRDAREAGWLRGKLMGLLATNSIWLDDDHPCLCYGMRGVLDLKVQITGGTRNLHSGAHGGLVQEPLADLLAVAASLTDAGGSVLAPGFDDDVQAMRTDDKANLMAAAKTVNLEQLWTRLGRPGPTPDDTDGISNMPFWRLRSACACPIFESLRRTWVLPSLSVTGFCSGLELENCCTPSHRPISCSASCIVSVRTVPVQRSTDVAKALRSHLSHEFSKRRSPNKLEVKELGAFEWWETSTESVLFRVAREGLGYAWSVPPEDVLAVREGGTMPMLRVLQEELGCDAVQIPLGQASDDFHLPNERISRRNLERAVMTLAKTLESLGQCCV